MAVKKSPFIEVVQTTASPNNSIALLIAMHPARLGAPCQKMHIYACFLVFFQEFSTCECITVWYLKGLPIAAEIDSAGTKIALPNCA